MPATQRNCIYEGLTLDFDRHYIGSVTATTHQKKGTIILKSNPSRGTVVPAPHGKGNKCDKNVKSGSLLTTPLTTVTGGNLPWFWVRMCGLSPRTPPHSYTRPSEKHDPFIYSPYRKLTPFIYFFLKLTQFIYYFSNFNHSYTFWVKKIPHWYTFDVKMIPIDILGGLKSIPHSSRTSVYTFIMEVTPPPVTTVLSSGGW